VESSYCSVGIKTKLDNANWLPIRHADTPVQKRFFGKPGRTQIRLGLSFPADAFSSAHIFVPSPVSW
jgi:hypothetical protein